MVRLNPRSLRVLDQDGEPDVMHSVEGGDHVGAFLKEAREVTGRSVADVAQTLRIRRVYLEAIEDGRFDELPGAAYAVGFIRSYATYLRLDVPETVDRFKSEMQGIEADQQLDFPTPVPEGRFPGGVVVTLCLLIAAAGFGGWYWWQDQRNIDVVRVPAPPQEVLTGSSDPAPDATPDTSANPIPQTTATEPVVAVAPVTEAPAAAAPEPVATADTPAAGDDSVTVEASETEPETELDTVVESEVSEATDEPAAREALVGETEPASVADAAASLAPPRAADQTDDVADTPAAPLEPDTAAVATGTEIPAESAGPEDTGPEGTASEDTGPEDTAPEAAQESAPEAVREPEIATASELPALPSGENTELNVGVAVPVEPSEPSRDSETSDDLPAIPETPSVTAADNDARTYGTVNRDARIVVSAVDADTWVQVMDSQENALLTQMLRPGDRYLVPNRPGLSLRTNNAGGLEIEVDGVAVPAIGNRGDIRRDVRLDPELLKSGTAVAQ